MDTGSPHPTSALLFKYMVVSAGRFAKRFAGKEGPIFLPPRSIVVVPEQQPAQVIGTAVLLQQLCALLHACAPRAPGAGITAFAAAAAAAALSVASRAACGVTPEARTSVRSCRPFACGVVPLAASTRPSAARGSPRGGASAASAAAALRTAAEQSQKVTTRMANERKDGKEKEFA